MFFFIGGIQPKTATLDENPRMCPACGLYQAKLVRIDHYLALFFIPLIRVKKGELVIQCTRCGHVTRETGEPVMAAGFSRAFVCPFCGRRLEKEFRYCPYCGKPVS
ncbi:MAG TPA: zinc ribbon domain-containing protein [Desulfobacteraceae bacterium]|nr:zinc ribbon domain-containing protein [Desulfobacteraceae bacterium]